MSRLRSFGCENDPTSLRLELSSGNLTLNSSSRFDGAVFAPEGRLTINASSQLVGHIQVKALTMNGGSRLRLVGDVGTLPNQPPYVVDSHFTVVEDEPLIAELAFTDPEGDALMYALVTDVEHGSLSLDTDGSFVYTPVADYFGSDGFVVSVSDGFLTVNTEITLAVTAVNDAPVVSAGTDTTLTLDLDYTIILAGSVIDDGLPPETPVTIVWTLLSGPGTATFAGAASPTSAVTFSEPGSYTLQLSADDSEYTITDSVLHTVEQTNRPSAFTSTPVTEVEEQTAYSYAVTTSDPDTGLGDSVTITATTLPTWISFTDNGDGTASLSGIPDRSDVGEHVVVLVVTDSGGANVEQSFSVVVNIVNTAPIGIQATYTLQEDTSLVFTLGGLDNEGDSLSFVITDFPADGTIEGNLPNLTYFPDTDFNGSDTLSFIANDGMEDSSETAIIFEVSPVNDAPVVILGEDIIIEVENTQSANLFINGNGEEFDGESAPLGWTMNPSNGVLSVDGSFILPVEGSRSLQVQDYGSVALYQEVDVSDAFLGIDDQTVVFQFSGYIRGVAEDHPDSAEINIQFYDEEGNSTGVSENILVDQAPSSWLPLAASFTPPVGTKSIGVLIIAERSVANEGNDLYFDDLCLVQFADADVEVCADVFDDCEPDGSELILEWNQLSGPMIQGVENIETECLTVKIPIPGQYSFELSASDGELEGSDVISINYVESGANSPYSISAGSDQYLLLPNATTTLEGFVSVEIPDEGGHVYWSRIEGPNRVVWLEEESLNPTATFHKTGTYVLRLTVNYQGYTYSDDVVITVDCPAEPIPMEIAIAIDHSGSMGSGPGSKLISARTATKRLIEGINPFHDRVALFTFDSVTPDVELTNDQDFLISQIFNLTGPSSDFGNGIAFAQDHFDQQARQDANRIIIIVADGNTGSSAVIAEANEAKAKGSRLITLGIGEDVNEDLLRAIASQESDYFFISKPSDTEFVFEEISTALCRGVDEANIEVNPGPDLYLPEGNVPVNIDAFVHFKNIPAGSVTEVEWSQVSGPTTASILNETTTSPEIIPGAPGVYVFNLRASAMNEVATVEVSRLLQVQVGYRCNVELNDSVVAWWTFNGNMIEQIRGLRSNVASEQYREAQAGLGYDCSGFDSTIRVSANDQIDLGSSPIGFTVEMWVNPENRDPGGEDTILEWISESGSGFKIVNILYDEIRVNLYSELNGDLLINSLNDQYPNNMWTHFAFTYDRQSGEARMYSNGRMIVRQNVGDREVKTTGDLWIGGNTSTGGYFNGGLDELALYESPLRQDEILEIYASGPAGKCPVIISNDQPLVDAGPDFAINDVGAQVTLNGQVEDTTIAPGSTISTAWTVESAPANTVVHFDEETSPVTGVTFSEEGYYTLRLTADDGYSLASDSLNVLVGKGWSVTFPEGLVAQWAFNNDLTESLGLYSGFGVESNFRTGVVSTALDTGSARNSVYVLEADGLNLGNSSHGFSIEMWVQPDDRNPGGLDCILEWESSSGAGVQIYNELYDEISVLLRNLSGSDYTINSTNDQFLNGTWTHFVFAYDRDVGIARIYSNGRLQTELFVGEVLADTLGSIWIGGNPNRNSYFNGGIDELALYSIPLTQIDILDLYSTGVIGKMPVNIANNFPSVYAGPDVQSIEPFELVNLSGLVADDGLPSNGFLSLSWTLVSGPAGAIVQFEQPDMAETTVSFSENGLYTLRLAAFDGLGESRDQVNVRVGSDCGTSFNEDMVAWWSFDWDTHERLIGNSGHISSETYRSGKVGGALDTGSSPQSMQVPASSELDIGASALGFSVDMWVMPDNRDPGGTDSILEWEAENGRGLRIVNILYDEIVVYFQDVTGSVQTLVSNNDKYINGTWTHFAVTYDRLSGVAALYSNGSMIKQVNIGDRRIESRGPLWIGGNPGEGSLFNGGIDELSFYNRPLDSSEIELIYLAETLGKCAGIEPITVNFPPVVDAGQDAVTDIDVGLHLSGSFSDDGLPEGGMVTYKWFFVSGPGSAFLDDLESLEPIATFSSSGTYTLELSVSDGELSAFDEVTIEVVAAPEVTLLSPSDGSQINSGDPVSFSIVAIDADGTVDSVEVFEDSVSLGLATEAGNGFYTFDLASTTEGFHQYSVVATDDTGYATTSDTVTVYYGDAPPTPTVVLTSPAEADRILDPVSVTGTVQSKILDSWVLSYKHPDSDSWTELASGSEEASDAALGTFDPTLLRNGIYDIRLTATDLLGRSVSETIPVAVVSDMKVGHFQVTFEDLSVPVSGIPIQVLRTYDSRDPSAGDFGPGWNLALNSIRIYKSGNLGTGWFQEQKVVNLPGVGETLAYAIEPLRRKLVTIVLPDDSVYAFEAKLDPSVQQFSPVRFPAMVFEPVFGTVGTLEAVESAGIEVSPLLGNVDLMKDDYSFEFYNPTRFVLTLQDGQRLVVDELDGLLSMEDRNGSKVTIDENGVHHSSGLSITYTRDATGRITAITDPAGQQLTYEYDEAGRLVAFRDREQNREASPLYGQYTSFAYENAAFPHYLTGITDPRGVQAIRSEYDEQGRLIRQVDADGYPVSMDHDIPNLTETVTDRLGNATVYAYNLRGDVVSQTTVDPANPEGPGLTTTYVVDERGNVLQETDPLGNVTESTYDARNNVLSETQYMSDGQGESVALTTSYTYDSNGNPLTITSPSGDGGAGQTTTFTYDAATGNLLTQEDATGQLTRFGYDSRGNVTTITDSAGTVTTNTYDSFGNVLTTSVTDAEGVVLRSSTFTYDSNGNQLTSSQTRTLYDATGNETGTETLTTQNIHDAEGRVIETILPDGSRMVTDYNAIGKQARTVDAAGRETFYDYDAVGNLTLTVYADGSQERSYYDAENRRTASTDRRGYTTYFVYDALGRLTDTIHPDETMPADPAAVSDPLSEASLADNPVTSTVYDAIGRVEASFDELGQGTYYDYDPSCGCSGRRATVTDALGNVTRFAYDAAGNQTAVTDANTYTTAFVYDDLNRPTRTTYPDGTYTETTYDALGRRSAERDQDGRLREFGYDALGRLTSVTEFLTYTAPDEPVRDDPAQVVTTRYVYDEAGNRIAQIDAKGHTTRYQYDALGRRTARILPALSGVEGPDGSIETYTYDAAGNLETRTDFRQYTTTYTYDALGRLLTETADPTHPSLVLDHAPAEYAYTYDAAGNQLTATVYGTGNSVLYSEAYGYDARGRLVEAATSHGTLTYSYDLAGNLTGVSSSNPNGLDLEYGYDLLNRLSTVRDHGAQQPPLEHTYTYNAVGSLETFTLASGIRHTWSYDSLNRLTDLTITDTVTAATVRSFAYTLSDSGIRQSITQSGPSSTGSGRIATYTYDGLNRLTSETITGDPDGLNGSVTYAYDKVGNRLGVISTLGGVEDITLDYDSNDRVTAHIYDNNGNTLFADGNTDSYDFRNRLIRRVKADGTTIDLIYSHAGDRIARSVQSVWQFYLFDRNNLTGYSQIAEVLIEDSQTGELTVTQVNSYGLDMIASATLSGEEVGLPSEASGEGWAESYFLYDGLGSITAIVDDQGVVTNTYTYSAYGALLSGTVNTDPTYLFTGELYDPQLEMYFLRARHYSPQYGRFWTMDTYEGRDGDPVSLHKYLYANANPVMYVDPSGKLTLVETMGVGAIIGVVSKSIQLALSEDTRNMSRLGIFGSVMGAAAKGALSSLVGVGAGKIAPAIFQKVMARLGPDGQYVITGAFSGATSAGFSEFVSVLTDWIVDRKEVTFSDFSYRIAKASFVGAGVGALFARVQFRPVSQIQGIQKTWETTGIWIDREALEEVIRRSAIAGFSGNLLIGALKYSMRRVAL